MHISRVPRAPLNAFVDRIWAADGGALSPGNGRRELMLPVEQLHLVIRLEDQPLRIFQGMTDRDGEAIGAAVIGGLRTAPYLRDVSRPVPCVGAVLRPGMGGLLAGAPAGEFAGAHTPVDDVWGPGDVDRLRARLAGAPSLESCLDLFETLLSERLPPVRHMDPRIAQALSGLASARQVRSVAQDLGTSHRHFTNLFREKVGLNPKTYVRLRRFGRALKRLDRNPKIAWADLAAAAGYADQPHFVREFREFSGITPGDYRRRAPASPRHVPV